jgi:hypothetical protein
VAAPAERSAVGVGTGVFCHVSSAGRVWLVAQFPAPLKTAVPLDEPVPLNEGASVEHP